MQHPYKNTSACDPHSSCIHHYVSKAFIKNCKGDFLNPTNEPCADVVQTISKVSFNFHLYLL